MPGPESLAVILAMAVLTFGTRIGGFWIMRLMPVTPTLEAFLRYLSGSVLVAILAPAVLDGGAPAVAAVLVAVLVMVPTRNMLLAMAGGVTAAAVLRALVA
jgi:uncharacterized membrane protein